jgi:predicted RNase H-like nuclease
MAYIGVDACKKGWFAVKLGSRDNWKIGIFNSVDDLWNLWNPFSIIFIDIPIGLPNSGRRACDIEARKKLGKRGSSVFAAPCREALEAKTYRQACRINKRVNGVKLSIQTWNICSKIREIDTWLRNNPTVQSKVRESHPELCFWAMAGGQPMVYTKKKPEGFEERWVILKRIYPHTEAIVELALGRFRRKDLARDDILDAIALAVSARCPAELIKTIPADPPRDKKGLPMEIVYALPAQRVM